MMKKKYAEMTVAERQAEYAAVQKEYEDAKALHLALNMARGKPGREQLELVMPILGVLTRSEQFLSDGVETRNYGEVSPRRGGCLRIFWAASPSRCSSAATPAYS